MVKDIMSIFGKCIENTSWELILTKRTHRGSHISQTYISYSHSMQNFVWAHCGEVIKDITFSCPYLKWACFWPLILEKQTIWKSYSGQTNISMVTRKIIWFGSIGENGKRYNYLEWTSKIPLRPLILTKPAHWGSYMTRLNFIWSL